MTVISGISIILPTLNERDNLKLLIPSIVEILDDLSIENYEVLVVDDNSTDGTKDLLERLNQKNSKIKIFIRSEVPSLPLSIWDGISNSKFEFVMWLDADGSMNAKSIKKLIKTLSSNTKSVIIGSRFVENGGYKGVKNIGKDSFIDAIKNVYKSNDSVFGMIFSIFFNKLLKFLFFANINDITSGFIIGNKKYFLKKAFSRSSYGEYFIYLCNDIIKQDIEITEVGYICETRVSGTSKTASSLLQLIKRGIPYIQAAIISRKEKYENLR